MLHTLFALWLAAAGTMPSSNRTSWMRPEAFHLAIGMSKQETTATLAQYGWDAKKGTWVRVSKPGGYL